MAYISICKALYDYEAQASDELQLTEDEHIYILDASDPEWWKAKRRPPIDPSSGQLLPFPAGVEEGQVGLVPANYVEESEPLRMSRALYYYEAQNDDELALQEDELLRVYEYEGEWLLVKKQGHDELGTGEGKLGFVPANYVDEVAAVDGGPTRVDTSTAVAQVRDDAEDEDEEEDATAGAISTAPPTRTIAVKSAGTGPTDKPDDIDMWAIAALDSKKKKKKGTLGIGNASLFFASESDKTPVQKISVLSITSHSVEKGKTLHMKLDDDVDAELAVEVEGGKELTFVASSKGDAEAIAKKLDSSKAVAREAARNPPPAKAAASSASPRNLRSLPPPPNGSAAAMPMPAALSAPAASPSVGLLPPPTRKSGLSPAPPAASLAAAVPALAPGEEHAIALYDFEAQGDDELSVAENEKVIIVEKENDDWWKVRNQHGQEGVVPASYVEAIAGDTAVNGSAAAAVSGADTYEDDEAAVTREAGEEMAAIQAAEAERQKAARIADMERRKAELVEKRRREEAEAKRREALKAQPAPAVPASEGRSRSDRDARDGGNIKVPSGKSAPERPKGVSSGRAKPSANNTRIWHDKSGQFKVDAEFLGFNSGKIRLHKMNGVVIEVAIEKMSVPDIQFLEDITGKRLMPHDDDLPLDRAPDRRRREREATSRSSRSGQIIDRPDREQDPRRSKREVGCEREREREARRRQDGRSRRNVDWFEFFLAAGVDMDDCTRYAAAFERDKIDEAILPELEASTLRSLGLREGDIIRVRKLIDRKYSPKVSSSSSKAKQIRADEELARRIQEEEQNARRGKTTSPAPPSLFSGPDGSLKNNTRRGRPTPSSSSRQTTIDSASLAAASESLRINNASPIPRNATTSPESGRKSAAPIASGFDDDAWTPRPPSAKPTTPAAPSSASEAVVAPPPPPPPASAAAAPAPAPPAVSAPVPPAVSAEPSKPVADPNSALFDKLAAMKPAAPTNGFGRPGAAPTNNAMMGSFNMGPRGPLAPVPQNQGLLQPLIPTQGTGQFVPTRQMGMQPQMTGWGGGMQPQLTGWGGMQPQQTGWGGMHPQATGFNGMQPQPTGFNGMGGVGMQSMATGFGLLQQPQTPFGMQMQPTGLDMQQQPQSTFGMLSEQAQKHEKEKDMTPSNIFAQMKSGEFARDGSSGAQPADKYDALRGFQTGSVMYPQNTGFYG
ncbi:hypothetical protein K437DRAFT_273215 [Tilletiaria anomala UBC 951]|uniref:Actin cytoskeleton-regulatory complex protein SLA1 n=1 Tax=Tilletiaria anomala (strain ATCC 24038 / CBS 436.72 / UBC 951) TaxID=1037660 RepID=A0A066WFN2_TILAU|nr:uncharacterized protein K437DRAFT_273215 [Tilletiaria anomala UBC 951]KDN49560.1 hypothetical protein K437DRAFT_273215 [Tilletiaria anomala UBC 951]